MSTNGFFKVEGADPSSRQRKIIRCREEDMILVDERDSVTLSTRTSSTFKASVRTVEGNVGQVVRGKERRQLPAHDCTECQNYYKYSRGLVGSALHSALQECSRHRYHEKRAESPEHYWRTDFPDSPEAIRKGWFVDETKKGVEEEEQLEFDEKSSEKDKSRSNAAKQADRKLKEHEKAWDWDVLERRQIKE